MCSFTTANEELDDDVCSDSSSTKLIFLLFLYVSILLIASLIPKMIGMSIGVMFNLVILRMVMGMKKDIVLCKELVGQFISNGPCTDFRFSYPA